MATKVFKSPKQGVLNEFGDQIGARGPMEHERENVLRRVFAYAGLLEIERVDWTEWGAGELLERLQKKGEQHALRPKSKSGEKERAR